MLKWYRALPLPWRRVILAAGLFLAGFLLSNFVLMPLVARQGEELEVPDLKGLGPQQARDAAAAAGFELMAVGWKNEPALPESSVASQTPEARKMLRRGRHIRVVLVRGAELVDIPYLVGLTAGQAVNLLSRTGLTVSRFDSLASDSVALGCVVNSTPAAGAKAKKGAPVVLTLSSGPTEGKMLMPELVGRSLAETQQTLVAQGLVIGEIKYLSGQSAEPGTIMLQAPQPGFVVKRGDTIDLAVSR
ncbi:MAG: PASTA domain-containing protein [Candidatus Edwardsbacteria bacterium]|jgi:serine/threonine-protein kinase|nr:PASTA domain-containing protein [Candidatus Edwardsbacteria bacterium]